MSARILAVEDTPHNLELMTYVLERHGYVVITATTVAEALEVARREVPDLLVLDVQLPDGTGYDIVRALADDEQLRDVPAVAVTAYAMLGDRDQGLAAGFDGYLTKPIDVRTFAASLGEFLPEHLRVGATPVGSLAEGGV